MTRESDFPVSRANPGALQDIMARHLPIYRVKAPTYQAVMLDSLRDLWIGPHRALLDVGGGTGVIAQAVSELFPVESVEAVDVVDRFRETLTVATRRYDGASLPFSAGQFDAAMLNNVMHHVPVEARAGLMREIRRVVAGPLYIKDHARLGRLDDARLWALDAIGNIPFGGMVWARYLGWPEWERLAAAAGWRIVARAKPRPYRSAPFAMLFPNRLEISLRLEPA